MTAEMTLAPDRAVITPGIPEKALFFGSTRPGTAVGEVARFVAQFKQWPAAAVGGRCHKAITVGSGSASGTSTAI